MTTVRPAESPTISPRDQIDGVAAAGLAISVLSSFPPVSKIKIWIFLLKKVLFCVYSFHRNCWRLCSHAVSAMFVSKKSDDSEGQIQDTVQGCAAKKTEESPVL